MWGLAHMVCAVPSAALPLKTFSSENLDNVFQECGEAICFLLQTTGARDLSPLTSGLPCPALLPHRLQQSVQCPHNSPPF